MPGNRRKDGMVALHLFSSLLVLVPQSILGFLSLYQGLLTAAAWRARRSGAARPLPTAVAHRFLVVIPAHDEERTIAETLRSLSALEYPPSHYKVHVVADNCSDATADVVRTHGFEVHERDTPGAQGKASALNWLLLRLGGADGPHDAVVILDADSSVSPNFLRVMDARRGRGDRVVQSYYGVRDPDGSWVIALRFAALAVRHYLRPLARTSFGGSAGLYGNGMVFTSDLLGEPLWADHLTEDIELEARLLLSGERVAFAPEAVVSAEMPDRLEGARTQNARWERGRVEVARRYVPQLLRASGLGGRDRLRCLDAAIDQLVPPLSVIATSAATTGLASLALWKGQSTSLSRINVAVSLGVAATHIVTVVSALRMVTAPLSVWQALFKAPVFVAWKLRLLLRVVSSREPITWVRTERNA